MSVGVSRWILLTAAVAVAAGSWCAAAVAQHSREAPAAAQASAVEQTVVLDTVGFWRLYHELKQPVMVKGAGVTVLPGKSLAMHAPTPPPPEGWTLPEFDDSGWTRRPALGAIHSPFLSRLCARGKFRVDDPRKVSGLRLSLGYHGGAIVYVNGKEVARRHLPSSLSDVEAPADRYDRAAFLDEKGNLIQSGTIRKWRADSNEATKRHPAMAGRRIDDLAIPSSMLRKGVNVLAIELHRAPYDSVVEEKKAKTEHEYQSPYDLAWNTCDLLSVRLTAAGGGGIESNATRPAGLQVWNSSFMTDDYDQDFGDRCEALSPVRLVTARGGAASGKVVVGCTEPLRGLRGRVTGFRGTGGNAVGATIPASAVRVRYATAWGEGSVVYPYSCETVPYPVQPKLLGALQEQPPQEVPVATGKAGRYNVNLPGQPAWVAGAVAPVWVTVSVPASAAAGQYEGTLTIEAQGHRSVSVPLALDVAAWTLPSTQDRRTWVELVQSSETLAVEYGLEPWSERHLEMIGRSLSLIGDTGSRVVYAPLIAQSHFGNAESMVLWIDKGNGSFEYDFSRMETYLDLVEKHMGKPKIVCLHVWDVYMVPTDESRRGKGDNRIFKHLEKTGVLMGSGPVVTLLDRATGERKPVQLARYDEPGGTKAWGPLFRQLRERLRRRGLEGAMMLGTFPDQWATLEEVAALKEASGDLPWVIQSHLGVNNKEGIYQGTARCGYQSRVWLCEYPSDLDKGGLHGWRRTDLVAKFNRVVGFADYPMAAWRAYPEMAIVGDQRGIARVGGDLWSAIKNRRGERTGTVTALFPQSSWRNLDPWAALLAPGTDGPVATTRYEALRAGLEACEARIVIEESLLDSGRRERLGAGLATRCEAALKDRMVTLWRSNSNLLLDPKGGGESIHVRGIAGQVWYEGHPWQDDTRLLLALAGEVEKAVGSNR